MRKSEDKRAVRTSVLFKSGLNLAISLNIQWLCHIFLGKEENNMKKLTTMICAAVISAGMTMGTIAAPSIGQ